MCINEKNEEIVERLKKLITIINIEQLQDEIRNKKVDEFSLRKLLWDCVIDFRSNLESIWRINNKKIENDIYLKNWLSELSSNENFFFDITEVNAPLNRSNPYIMEFYKELEEKYSNKKAITYPGGLYFKKLMLHSLDKEDQSYASILSMYIEVFWLNDRIKKLIDFIDVI